MRRRRFLASTFAGAGTTHLALGDPVFDPPDEETIRISLFHTTDLHGHILPTQTYDGVTDVGGFARCLSRIRSWRRSNPNHLSIDLGDLYQGTHVSLENEGELMIKLLNAANFDAWVAGNHDFDWGENVFAKAVKGSSMPVISANLEVDGFASGESHHQGGSFANLLPTAVKEVAGIRIGILGLTTPGLPFWLNPSQLGSVEARDPLEATKRAIASLREQRADAIVAAGHMGLRPDGSDDYANQVNRILLACPEIDIYLAGHTHRDRPSTVVGRTLYTQAGYFGIWCGRVDLTFTGENRGLVRREARTEPMDHTVDPDPLVLQIAGEALERSEATLRTVVGTLERELRTGYSTQSGPDVQALIAAGITHALNQHGEKVDAVLHGSFTREPIPAGEKTIADMWAIVPYENRIVTATLNGEQLLAILQEADSAGGNRRLVGFEIETNEARRVSGARNPDGQPVAPGDQYRIAFNSYDAQSGGRRLPLLREILSRDSSRTIYHEIETRSALTDYFLDRKSVGTF